MFILCLNVLKSKKVAAWRFCIIFTSHCLYSFSLLTDCQQNNLIYCLTPNFLIVWWTHWWTYRIWVIRLLTVWSLQYIIFGYEVYVNALIDLRQLKFHLRKKKKRYWQFRVQGLLFSLYSFSQKGVWWRTFIGYWLKDVKISSSLSMSLSLSLLLPTLSSCFPSAYARLPPASGAKDVQHVSALLPCLFFLLQTNTIVLCVQTLKSTGMLLNVLELLHSSSLDNVVSHLVVENIGFLIWLCLLRRTSYPEAQYHLFIVSPCVSVGPASCAGRCSGLEGGGTDGHRQVGSCRPSPAARHLLISLLLRWPLY